MSGTEVAVGVRSRVVRIEVEHAIVRVGVIVATDVRGVKTGVRVDTIRDKPGSVLRR